MRVDGWAIYEAYRQLPVWFRATLGTGLIIVGFTSAWTNHQRYLASEAEEKRTGKQSHPLVSRNYQGGFQFGLYLTFAGLIVTMTSGRSRAERNGYRF